MCFVFFFFFFSTQNQVPQTIIGLGWFEPLVIRTTFNNSLKIFSIVEKNQFELFYFCFSFLLISHSTLISAKIYFYPSKVSFWGFCLKLYKRSQKFCKNIFFKKNFYKYCFSIGLFNYDCRVCLIFLFSFKFLFITAHRKNNYNFLKKCFIFVEAMAVTLCATCTVTGYHCS